MKKITAILLAMLMSLTVVAMTGCGAKAEPLKFGMGVYSYYAAGSNADGETNGSGEAVSTVAAVLVDADGKIVKCVIDVADNKANWTSEGTVVAAGALKTKLEKGTEYGMAAYGTDRNGDGKVLEWYEQIAAFCSVVEGKTIDQVKALVVDGYGTEEVANAGCTITISDFVLALEKAVANVADSDATANDTLDLGVSSEFTGTDATEEADGAAKIDVTFVAAAVDADGKVSAIVTDVVQTSLTFDVTGAATYDAAAALKTKLEKGTEYGMAAHGTDRNGDGKVLEWFEQAAAFNATCLGKTSTEIAALVADDGYGVESLQTAGCTITASELVAAAVKATTH